MELSMKGIAPNITLQPSLKSGPDQSRLHTSRRLDVARFSSRLNSAVRRGLGEGNNEKLEQFIIPSVINNIAYIFGYSLADL